MRKIRFIILGLAILLSITVAACSGKTVPDEGISEGSTLEHEGNDTANKSEDNNDNSLMGEDEENDTSMRMEILFENEKFYVTDPDKVNSLYNELSSLTYETAEDQSLFDAINIYFYDENDNMVTMFAVYENYLKLNGTPDTYEITSDDFNYDAFVEEIEAMK